MLKEELGHLDTLRAGYAEVCVLFLLDSVEKKWAE